MTGMTISGAPDQAHDFAGNSLIEELQGAVSGGTPESRRAALFHATDLLIAGRYSSDQIWVFGEIITLLAAEIELAAKVRLAGILAASKNAPMKVIHNLAFDDSIAVAGPVLRECSRLENNTLVENAKTKSQGHLLAISRRNRLSEQVTDVLVQRGSQEVVRSVARNEGAKFSDSGFWSMVRRSENDSILAESVGMRRDIPRHYFQQLIARASDEVKEKLAALYSEAGSKVHDVVTEVAGTVQSKFGPASRTYFAAKKAIGELHRAGELTKGKLHELARARKFEEVTVALSLLHQIPVDVIERALLDEHRDMIMIIAKATDLDWSTTRLLLSLRGPEANMSDADLTAALKGYSQLSTATARQVLNFYRLRKQEFATPEQRELPQIRRV